MSFLAVSHSAWRKKPLLKAHGVKSATWQAWVLEPFSSMVRNITALLLFLAIINSRTQGEVTQQLQFTPSSVLIWQLVTQECSGTSVTFVVSDCVFVPFLLIRDKAAVEQRHHSVCLHLALHRLLVRHAPHRLGRVRLRAPQDLLHSGLQQGRQVLWTHREKDRKKDKYRYLCVVFYSLLCVFLSTETTCLSWSPWLSATWPSSCLLSCPLTSPLHRNSRRLETPGWVNITKSTPTT